MRYNLTSPQPSDIHKATLHSRQYILLMFFGQHLQTSGQLQTGFFCQIQLYLITLLLVVAVRVFNLKMEHLAPI